MTKESDWEKDFDLLNSMDDGDVWVDKQLAKSFIKETLAKEIEAAEERERNRVVDFLQEFAELVVWNSAVGKEKIHQMLEEARLATKNETRGL